MICTNTPGVFQRLFLLCLSAAVTAGLCLPAAAADRPNILWLTAEDMSPTLACWGDRYAVTPNLDRLARQSVRYTQAFATAPVCSPARSCLITGCYATSLGTQRLRSSFPVPERMLGFPALLRQAGYYCTNNVKTDYNTSRERAIIQASWDECSANAHWRNRKKGQPFFSVFNDMTSHQSRTMVWPYEQFRKEVQSQLEPGEIHDPDHAPVPPYYPDTPLVRKTIARYYDCVTVMDKQVGQLLDQLEEDGLAEETIVFFYSDHGSGMPRHKRALLDSGMHVPLLVRFPEKYRHLAPAGPGETVDRLVSFVDFAPTVLSLCGVAIPEYMQGVPFLGPEAGGPRRFVFGARDRVDEVYDLARSVRSRRFLYIRNFMPHLSYHQPSAWPDQGAVRREITRFAREHADSLSPAQRHYAGPTRPREELYDIEADPLNLDNLAGSSEHARALETMRGELEKWILRTRDFGFLPEAEAWRRIGDATPWEVARDPRRYPLPRLLEAAGRVGEGPEKLDQIQRGLKDGEPGVRYWSAGALAALGEKAAPARAALEGALEDPAPDVRIEAANALARAGFAHEALPVLIGSLEGQHPSAVLRAARTIQLLGPQAAAATPAMQAVLRRQDQHGDQHLFIQFAAEAFLNSSP